MSGCWGVGVLALSNECICIIWQLQVVVGQAARNIPDIGDEVSHPYLWCNFSNLTIILRNKRVVSRGVLFLGVGCLNAVESH